MVSIRLQCQRRSTRRPQPLLSLLGSLSRRWAPRYWIKMCWKMQIRLDVFEPSKEWATICMHEVFQFQKRKLLRERIRGRTWEKARRSQKGTETQRKRSRQARRKIDREGMTCMVIHCKIQKWQQNCCATIFLKVKRVISAPLVVQNKTENIYIYYTKQVSNQFYHYYVEHPVSLFTFFILNKLNANTFEYTSEYYITKVDLLHW